jgi:hypothetical protein
MFYIKIKYMKSKKLKITTIPAIVGYMLLAFVFSSCSSEPIENHTGGIVYAKESPPAGKRFVLKYKADKKYKFKRVYVLDLDFNKYNVGDTIK